MSDSSDAPKPTKGRIQAVFGGGHRTGRWHAADITSVLAVFGRTVIDLRNAETTAERLVFRCMSVFGSVVFVVPEAADVRTSGLAVLASQRSAVPASDESSSGPTIDIDATTVLGKLHVVIAVPASRKERRAAKAASAAATPIGSSEPEETTEAPTLDVSPPATATPERVRLTPNDEPASQGSPEHADELIAEAKVFVDVDQTQESPRPETPHDTADVDVDPVGFLDGLEQEFSPEGPPTPGAQASSLAEAMPDTSSVDPDDVMAEPAPATVAAGESSSDVGSDAASDSV